VIEVQKRPRGAKKKANPSVERGRGAQLRQCGIKKLEIEREGTENSVEVKSGSTRG
jgi:hypothetical protein